MTYREHVQWMKKYWIGKTVSFEGQCYKVVDVDYNCALLISKKAPFTETTAVDPSRCRLDTTANNEEVK